MRVHFVHVRRGGIPLILTHGWPSAFIEALGLIDRLPGFDLVIPSLPGYGFCSRPDVCTTPDVAALWHTLMQGLGYERYGAGGGDWGAAVTTYMALQAPERMLGIHLSGLDNAPEPKPPFTEAEREFMAVIGHWDVDPARLQHDPEHAAPDARLRPHRLTRRPGRLDRREVALAGPTRTCADRPRLPAHARDPLLGHQHDLDRQPRLHRQLRRRHRRAWTTTSPSAPRSPTSTTSGSTKACCRASGRSAPTTSSASPTCPAAATSPPPRPRTCSRPTSPRSSRP